MRSWLAVFLKLVLLLIALFALMPQYALALTASQVYEQVKDSIVVVKAYDQKGQQVGLGSGVMLPSGDIITNYHVVKAGVRYTVGRGTKAKPATLKSGDPDKDLCLLTSPSLTAKPARLGKAARLKVGEPVYAVGAPQGLELSLSEGIVSQLRGGPPPLIQTTVAISPGSSGGGLFNAEGELVGITTFYLKDSQSLNFALPVEWIGEVARRKTPERAAIVADKAPSAPVPGARPKEGWENRADALVKAQDWQGLSDHCRRWTKAEPGNNLAWLRLIFAYNQLGNRGAALDTIYELRQYDPERASTLINFLFALETIEHRLKKWDKKNGPPEDWGEQGVTLHKARDWQGLSAHCRRWTKAEPGNASAWFGLGVAYGELGRHREAIEAYREALRLKPDDAVAWFNLGGSYGELGRHREAIEAWRERLRLKPDDAVAWFNLGGAYGELSRHREEIEAYREALRLKPDLAEAWNNLGGAYGKLGRYREAVEAFREALRLKPDHAKAWNNLACAYALSGNRSAALQAVKELRRYDPQGADKLFNLIMKP